jgi:hypothetical protein
MGNSPRRSPGSGDDRMMLLNGDVSAPSFGSDLNGFQGAFGDVK